MTRKIFVYNPDLEKTQRSDDPVIDVVGMTIEQLLGADWLYDNYWPETKFIYLLRKIQELNPSLIIDNPVFWDSGLQGIELYNHSIDELSQTEGLDY